MIDNPDAKIKKSEITTTLEPQQEDSYRSQLNESTGIGRGSVFVGKSHKNALFFLVLLTKPPTEIMVSVSPAFPNSQAFMFDWKIEKLRREYLFRGALIIWHSSWRLPWPASARREHQSAAGNGS